MTDDQQPTIDPIPDPLPPEHVDKLVDGWMAGFVSGMTTALAQGHRCSDPDCPVAKVALLQAQAYAQLTMSDPAFRLELAAGCERKWHNPDVEIGLQEISAYPAAWNGGTK